MAFGQGLDATMVQVCTAFSTIINGGTRYQPTVIAGTMSDDGKNFTAAPPKEPKFGVIGNEASTEVREMIHQARTAFYSSQDRKGYYIGGKTGTSQTLRDNKYVDDETVGTYLGFGGSSEDRPEYVIMVQVSADKKELAGARDAMPIFTDISNWMIDYLKLQPKG
jgi:cell division protein FtsI/penicillin-binding protein 2